MSNLQLAIQFFFQLALILTVCQTVGILARRMGQPQVVAEMLSGVLLGPSLFGILSPELFALVFPAESMRILFPVSQLGLALYMFVVGLEFRAEIMAESYRSSVAVSVAGMVAPFVLGSALALVVFEKTELFPSGTGRFEAAIFLGACMCITAFPMLARIIHFKKLTGSRMGTVAIGAGAIDDAAAWCLLALVLACFDGNPARAFKNIGGALAYFVVTMFFLRPALARWACRIETKRGYLTDCEFALMLAFMALGAWFTDLIGLHAVFGAFLMGTAMPKGIVAEELVRRVQPLTVALLLPLFFTYSGLNTRIALLDNAFLWGIAGSVLIVAILGKGGACWLAGRLGGLSNREALGVGILMNARGLMELIIINIGLERGLISAELFAILVVMAVVTTLMASPIFDRLVAKETLPEQ